MNAKPTPIVTQQRIRTTRGAALLAFAGSPTPRDFSTMVACAENLERDLLAVTVGERPGGLISTPSEIARLVAAARRVSAAVVVVAGDTSPWVVRRLASAARRPVLVARTRQRWGRVLVATDLQSRALPVVAAGAAVAAARNSEAIVLHNVVPAWSTTAAGRSGGAFAAGVARRLRRLVRATAQAAPDAKVVVCSSRAPSRAIADAVVERGADVLVLGMRRPRPQTRRRCADQVVVGTSGNVLVVPIAAKRRARDAEVVS